MVRVNCQNGAGVVPRLVIEGENKPRAKPRTHQTPVETLSDRVGNALENHPEAYSSLMSACVQQGNLLKALAVLDEAHGFGASQVSRETRA